MNPTHDTLDLNTEPEPAAFTVRVLSDGELVQDDVTFTDEQEDAAESHYYSTCDYYAQSDIHTETAVQLFNASGDILAERTFIPTA